MMAVWSRQRRAGAGVLFLAILAGLALVPSAVPHAQAPNGTGVPGPRLFRDAATIRLIGPEPDRQMVRRRLTQVDLAAVGGRHGALTVAPRLTLNLFPNVEMAATLTRVERTPRSQTWVGTVDGQPLSGVFLTVVNGTLTGTVAMPGAHYIIESDGDAALVAEIDDTRSWGGDDVVRTGPGIDAISRPNALVVPPDDPGTIDVLVVYTEAARRDRGLNRVLALIDQAVAYSNESLRNGGLSARVRVPCLMEVAYEETKDSLVDVQRLATPGDGYLDEVLNARSACGADVSALFVLSLNRESCGRAYMSTQTFGLGTASVTSLDCSVSVFAHELGHNLGANHDWYASPEPGWTNASHGHVDSGAGWFTVMAYSDRCFDEDRACARIPFYSSPSQTYRGASLGVAAGTNVNCRARVLGSKGCDADNVTTLATVIPRVANLRYGRVSGSQVNFPVRNETFDFRTRLDAKYRDDLRRAVTSTFSDPEGSVVWTQEYLMYRVQGCSHEQSVSRIRIQMGQLGLPGVCGPPAAGEIAFPPRDQTYRFRLELESIYRNELNRPAVQTFVDPEGDVVWIQEYLRYRLNGCGHETAVGRVMNQVDGRGTEPVCR